MSHIEPAFHEVDAFLWFDQHGLSPYWTVGSLCIQQVDGYGETTVELADGVWRIKLAYNANTGIAPRATSWWGLIGSGNDSIPEPYARRQAGKTCDPVVIETPSISATPLLTGCGQIACQCARYSARVQQLLWMHMVRK